MPERCRFEIIKGPSGSGKTAELAGRAMDDLVRGEKVIFLVPDQTSASAEYALSRECRERGVPRDRLEILSFSRLAHGFFLKYGGIGNVPPRVARRLYLWRAFTELDPMALECYGRMSEHADRFIPALADLLDEIKRNGVKPEDLDIFNGRDRKTALGLKLADISLILAKYNRLLSESGASDPSDEVARFASALASHGEFFAGASVYVDGFVHFTAPELGVLSEVMRNGRSLTVSLCFEDGRDSIFRTVGGSGPDSQLNRIRKKAADAGIAPVETVRRSRKPDPRECTTGIYGLKTHIYSDMPEAVGEMTGVSFYRLKNPYSEAEFAACEILRAMSEDRDSHKEENIKTAGIPDSEKKEEKTAFSDFTVIVGDPAAAGLVSVTLGKHGIPNHVSVRTELRETRLFRLVLSALAIARYGWRREDVLTLLKTGLTGVPRDKANALENYAALWRINGEREWNTEWDMSPGGIGGFGAQAGDTAGLLGMINGARAAICTGLGEFESELSGGGTVIDACRALYGLLHKSFKVDAGLDGWDDPAEGKRFWNMLMGVLDAIAGVAGDMKARSGDSLIDIFSEIFEVAVTGASAGSLPEKTGEVTVSVFGAHTPHTKRAIILGCNHGVLPPSPPKGTILTDREIDRIYRETGIEIGTPAEDRYYLDNLDFYLALCVPSVSLMLTYSEESAAGETLIPSEQFETARRIFAEESKKAAASGPDLLDFIRDRASAREIAGLLAGTDDGKTLSDLLGLPDTSSSPLCSGTGETLSPGTVSERKTDGAGRMTVSPSELDSFVSCPLCYALRYEAGVSVPPDIEADRVMNDGSILHRIMEDYFRDEFDPEKEGGVDFAAYAEEKTDEILRDVMPTGDRGALSASRKHGLEALRQTAGYVLRALDERQRETAFTPAYFEYKVGADGGRPVANVCGTDISVKGKADRIDVFDDAESGRRYVRVVDYKSSSKDFATEKLSEGELLQMFLYLYGVTEDEREKVFRDAEEAGLTPAPAAVTYYTVKPKKPDRADDYFTKLRELLKIEGVYDGEIRDRFESAIRDKKNSKGLTEFGGFSVVNAGKANERTDHFSGSYGEIRDTVTGQVGRICGEILNGDAGARPRKRGTADNACKYCGYKAVCRSRAIRMPAESGDGEKEDN